MFVSGSAEPENVLFCKLLFLMLNKKTVRSETSERFLNKTVKALRKSCVRNLSTECDPLFIFR